MDSPVSIAIETSCQEGGVALGLGKELAEAVAFSAASRHAVSLIARLDEMLKRQGLAPGDLDEVYVSMGPGGFTGLRIGITVARTLAQTFPKLRCVAVGTPWAVAWNARDLDWQDLVVVQDAKDDRVFVTPFSPGKPLPEPAGEGTTTTEADFLAGLQGPTLLIGEGLRYHTLEGKHVALAGDDLALPTAEGVWHVGRQMAEQGQFTDYRQLLPVYARQPEAVRLWEKRKGANE